MAGGRVAGEAVRGYGEPDVGGDEIEKRDGKGTSAAPGSGVDLYSLGRTVCVVGAGVRAATGIDALRSFLESTGLAFVSSFGGADILPDHTLRRGVLGTHGEQTAVDAVAGADARSVLGCRLAVNTRGYNDEFIKGKNLVVVDIEPKEHEGREVVVQDGKEWLRTHTVS